MKFTRVAVFAAALLLTALPWATAADSEPDRHHAGAASGQAHTGKGIVKWVDAVSGEIDVRHEPMPSLKWPAMTMTFKAHDAAMLKGLKKGDEVEFDLVKMGDKFHITRIVPASAGQQAHHDHGGHGHHDAKAKQSSAGKPGKASAAKRVVQVSMFDTMRYDPSSITVKPGETVKFVVENKGALAHEFGIGTSEEQMQHEEMMKAMPNMKHDDSNVVTVEPGKKKELVWQFTKAGTFEIACHVPGHYPAGMKLPVVVGK